MLQVLFKQLDLDNKEYQVFTSLYKLGTNPASVVANHAGLERTTTYRILKKLKKQGLISATTRQGMQVFFVEDEKTLLKFIQNKRKELESLEEQYDLVEAELKNLRPESLNPPKIKIYDDPSVMTGSKKIFHDILDEIHRQNLTTIRLLASDTFTEQIGKSKLADVGDLFIKEMEKEGIRVDALIAEGMLTRERLEVIENLTSMYALPASNGATHIYLTGDTLFIILFKENTIGLQVSHPDIAQTMHFVFDQLKKG